MKLQPTGGLALQVSPLTLNHTVTIKERHPITAYEWTSYLFSSQFCRDPLTATSAFGVEWMETFKLSDAYWSTVLQLKLRPLLPLLVSIQRCYKRCRQCQLRGIYLALSYRKASGTALHGFRFSSKPSIWGDIGHFYNGCNFFVVFEKCVKSNQTVVILIRYGNQWVGVMQ